MTDTTTTTTSPNLWKQVTGWVDTEFNDFLTWIKNFWNTVLPAEVSALTPYAEQAVEEAVIGLPALLTGGLPAYAAAVAPILLATAQKAEAAGVAAAGPSLLTAVGGAVANAQAAIPAVAATNLTTGEANAAQPTS